MRRFYLRWRGEYILLWLWIFRQLSLPKIFRMPYQVLLRVLIRKTELFDEAHYLEVNHDVAESQQNPLHHFVVYGDREGRWPMPLFDPQYYRSRAGGFTHKVNSLLHYSLVGRHCGISPSVWFDINYYLSQNHDVARSGVDPLLHYLRCGGLEGRSPNPQFDGNYYLHAYPDASETGQNPLLHYMNSGRHEDRSTRKLAIDNLTDEGDAIEDQATAFDSIQIEGNLSHSNQSHRVDIIVPVYKNRALTRRCLHSVLKSRNETSFKLIVIDDCSPEAKIKADLAEMSAQNWITLIENERNLGFVATVNLGMSLHPDRDIVILNSDTEVYDGWLDRLHQAAYRSDKIASVTPLSNNATICSYPRFLHDNPYPLEVDYPTLDQLTAKVNAGVTVEAPTGVGFCMYMNRAALNTVGNFDEIAFGKGYGEENDWCQRALKEGWHNLIAADVFVRHFGSASFQGEKKSRVANALKVLAAKHPTYDAQVQRHITTDPLLEARQRLDWARLEKQSREKNVLMVCHNRGGGAEKHLQEDAFQLRRENQGVFLIRPFRGNPGNVRIQSHACRQLLNLPSFRLDNTEALADVLHKLNITRIHTHGLVDFENKAPLHLLKLCKASGSALHVDIHDYKVICPRINLADENGHYCGEPDISACNVCLIKRGNEFGETDIKQWRSVHHRILRAAEKVWVPDRDVAKRLSRYYPDVQFSISPHEQMLGTEANHSRPISLAQGKNLRVVVIGAISKIKGYNVLLECAKDARKRRLPIEYVVMGYSMNDSLLHASGVHITGKYDDRDAPALLKKQDPHMVWLPSTWPETYSYTLSIAQRGGYPVAAFDIGAIASRINDQGGGLLLPIDIAGKPAQINNRFISIMREITLKSHHEISI